MFWQGKGRPLAPGQNLAESLIYRPDLRNSPARVPIHLPCLPSGRRRLSQEQERAGAHRDRDLRWLGGGMQTPRRQSQYMLRWTDGPVLGLAGQYGARVPATRAVVVGVLWIVGPAIEIDPASLSAGTCRIPVGVARRRAGILRCPRPVAGDTGVARTRRPRIIDLCPPSTSWPPPPPTRPCRRRSC